MDDAEEEEGAARQENSRGSRQRRRHGRAAGTAGGADGPAARTAGTDDELAVAVPLNHGGRVAVGRALQRHRIVTGYRHVRRMLSDPRRFTHYKNKSIQNNY